MALVHDALVAYGGAEKVLEELHKLFPEAPVFAPIYNPGAFPSSFQSWDIRTTWMDRVPFARKGYRALFPIYPFAMQSIDLSAYDVVISSSFSFAHHIHTTEDAVHLCYCHSPARFMWDYHRYANNEGFGWLKQMLIGATIPIMKALDRSSAGNVDQWISTSNLITRRIHKSYGFDSVIIPPPVDLNEFHVGEGKGDYFLLLMRLVGWKRADIVVRAATDLGLPLVVAGSGRELASLRKIAGPTVTFAGRVDGQAKADLYANCRAFILPSSEDFGITPLEAMASGRPVIAYRHGGVLDTVVEGVTGAFFDHQTPESVADAMRNFDPSHYDSARIRDHAANFDSSHFARKILDLVVSCRAERKKLVQFPLTLQNGVQANHHIRAVSGNVMDFR
ncbi:hypothetical protein BJF93_15215 [Xaviernesmea oryzae]|uniref:Glycosyl transferase n=1 Tax=Xaviernesmea oryzae TaxID=464029 RepID=A0A1Q9AXX3_9HYPH|nr:hypothetical protein BJF93_15215 [Xaviernesmea oryzae]